MKQITLLVDGGMHGLNPGGRLYSSYAFNDIKETVEYGIAGTNNEAEYLALIQGVSAVINEFGDVSGIDLMVKTDSELVRLQVLGVWRIHKQHLLEPCRLARSLLANFANWRIEHVPRDEVVAVLGH